MDIKDIFEQKTRDNGVEYYALANKWHETPLQDWVRESVHNKVLPNDFAYEQARHLALVALELSEIDDEEERSDRTASEADNFAGLHSNKWFFANWIQYCDGLDLISEYKHEGLLYSDKDSDLDKTLTQGVYWWTHQALERFPYDILKGEA